MRSVQRLETASGRGGVARPRRLFVSLLVLSLALHGACAASVTERSEPGDALPLSVGLWPQGALLIKPGINDVKNKYLPAVAVFSDFYDPQGRRHPQACSGALLNPRLVITAGHCVCAARPATEHEQPPRSSVPLNVSLWASRAQTLAGVTLTEIWDGNGPCASHATVTVIRYGPDSSDEPKQEIVKAEDTEVLLHPKFEILMGRRNGAAAGVVWASADLAAIELREPVKMKFQPLALPEKEVGVGDDIVMSGYGTLATSTSPLLRQFGDSRVTLIVPLETGSVFFRTEQRSPRGGRPGSYAEAGDSGGPAVRLSAPRTLVGIVSIGATRADGTPMSLFMSAYSHKQWMQQMLRRVIRSAPSRPGSSGGGRRSP